MDCWGCRTRQMPSFSHASIKEIAIWCNLQGKHRSVVWATRETKAMRCLALGMLCVWAALPEALNAPLRTFCPRHCSLHCCSAAPVAHTGVDLVSESYVTTAKVRYQFDDSILASRSFLWGLNWKILQLHTGMWICFISNQSTKHVWKSF